VENTPYRAVYEKLDPIPEMVGATIGEALHVKIDSEATAYIVNNIANRRQRVVPSGTVMAVIRLLQLGMGSPQCHLRAFEAFDLTSQDSEES
jgi:hypothetical protein